MDKNEVRIIAGPVMDMLTKRLVLSTFSYDPGIAFYQCILDQIHRTISLTLSTLPEYGLGGGVIWSNP